MPSDRSTGRVFCDRCLHDGWSRHACECRCAITNRNKKIRQLSANIRFAGAEIVGPPKLHYSSPGLVPVEVEGSKIQIPNERKQVGLIFHRQEIALISESPLGVPPNLERDLAGSWHFRLNLKQKCAFLRFNTCAVNIESRSIMVRRSLLLAPSISPYFRSLFAQQSTPITVQTCETPFRAATFS